MTNDSLAASYLQRAGKRLRHVGVEPPKWHDVGPLLLSVADRLVPPERAEVGRLAEISRWLRDERERAFYGEEDFIPSDGYERGAAERAIRDAEFVLHSVTRVLQPHG